MLYNFVRIIKITMKIKQKKTVIESSLSTMFIINKVITVITKSNEQQ